MTALNQNDHQAHIVYLENNYGKNILPLSAVDNDRFPGGGPVEILLFYKKQHPPSKFEASLFKTIEHYNLFSSRLIMIDNNKFALQYCTDGVKFNILPPVDAAFDEIKIDDIKKMMAHVVTLPGEPLLAVTGIPVKDGIFGGFSCSHTIADGISLMLFLYAWGCILEGKSFLPPSAQRLFKGEPVHSDKIDKAFIPPLTALSDKIQNRAGSLNIRRYFKREYFSDELLREIKNKAKSESERYIISNNQIMTAFLLKKYHHLMLPDTDRIRLKIPVDFREIHPDIDSLYIGNAVLDSFTAFSKDELNKMSIFEIAYRLKESVTRTRDEKYVKEMAYLSPYGIEFQADILENYPSFNIDTDIVSSNLTHLSDLESLGIGSEMGSFVHINSTIPTSFIMFKEKTGRIFAQLTSRFPFT